MLRFLVLLGAAHGLRVNLSLARPILFVKTHKTGSSTMANIVHRLGDARNLKFMLPTNGIHLGWPGSFPGRDFSANPAHQYDIVCNHAVYNGTAMLAYLKEQPVPFRLTLLREPLAQLVSAFRYFRRQRIAERIEDGEIDDATRYEQPSPAGTALMKGMRAAELAGGSDLWATRIKFLRHIDDHPFNFHPYVRARFRNPQAHDLGFYELFKHRRPSWKEVEDWIDGLNFDQVVLTEHYSEGLVLLRGKLNLDMQEVSSLHFKDQGASDGDPHATNAELVEIAELYGIDYALYAYFEGKFKKEWSSRGKESQRQLKELNELNAHITEVCAPGNATEECTWQLKADSQKYTRYLRQKEDAYTS